MEATLLMDATVENEYECVKSAMIIFPVIINSTFALENRFVFLDGCPRTVSRSIHYSKM